MARPLGSPGGAGGAEPVLGVGGGDAPTGSTPRSHQQETSVDRKRQRQPIEVAGITFKTQKALGKHVREIRARYADGEKIRSDRPITTS